MAGAAAWKAHCRFCFERLISDLLPSPWGGAEERERLDARGVSLMIAESTASTRLGATRDGRMVDGVGVGDKARGCT
jgi:hypothetical protein